MDRPQFRYQPQAARPKHKSYTWVLLILSFFCIGYVYLAVKKPLPPLSLSTSSVTLPAEKVTIDWPSEGWAAIGSMNSGLLAKSASQETAEPIASVAKVMTALAVLNKKPILPGKDGEIITLGAQDVEFYDKYISLGGSNSRVTAGETITERQALEALMLPSSNNMADSLALWAFGSLDNYKTYASALVKSYGLTNTTINDASGFDSATTSTASELIILGQRALKNEVLRAIVAEKNADIPVAGPIENVNSLLGEDDIIGIKTGNTGEAGGCLLFAAYPKSDSKHSDILIGAVIGASSLDSAFSVSKNLLSSLNATYKLRDVAKNNQKIGHITSKWGQSADVLASETLSTYAWEGEVVVGRPNISQQYKTVKAGQNVGSLQTGQLSVPLVAGQTISGPSILWRLKHYF